MFDPHEAHPDWLYLVDEIICRIDDIFEARVKVDPNDPWQVKVVAKAVQHDLVIMGEATNRIPKSIHEQYDEPDWRGIIELRNVLVHQYDHVKLDIIETIIRAELTPLREKLESISSTVRALH